MQTWYKKVLAQNAPVSRGSPFYIPQKQVGPSELDRRIDRENLEKAEKILTSELKVCIFRHLKGIGFKGLSYKDERISFKAIYRTDKKIASLIITIDFVTWAKTYDNCCRFISNTYPKFLMVKEALVAELKEVSGSLTNPKIIVLIDGKPLSSFKCKNKFKDSQK